MGTEGSARPILEKGKTLEPRVTCPDGSVTTRCRSWIAWFLIRKEELLLERGFEIGHEVTRAQEFRFAPMVSENVRPKYRGATGGLLVPRRPNRAR